MGGTLHLCSLLFQFVNLCINASDILLVGLLAQGLLISEGIIDVLDRLQFIWNHRLLLQDLNQVEFCTVGLYFFGYLGTLGLAGINILILCIRYEFIEFLLASLLLIRIGAIRVLISLGTTA